MSGPSPDEAFGTLRLDRQQRALLDKAAKAKQSYLSAFWLMFCVGLVYAAFAVIATITTFTEGIEWTIGYLALPTLGSFIVFMVIYAVAVHQHKRMQRAYREYHQYVPTTHR